jgi:hypothetical protein
VNFILFAIEHLRKKKYGSNVWADNIVDPDEILFYFLVYGLFVLICYAAEIIVKTGSWNLLERNGVTSITHWRKHVITSQLTNFLSFHFRNFAEQKAMLLSLQGSTIGAKLGPAHNA